jgi:hypothetical protein
MGRMKAALQIAAAGLAGLVAAAFAAQDVDSPSSDSADCGQSNSESVLVLRQDHWTRVAGKIIHACNGLDDPGD